MGVVVVKITLTIEHFSNYAGRAEQQTGITGNRTRERNVGGEDRLK